MESMHIRALLIEDSETDAALLRVMLGRQTIASIGVEWAENLKDGLAMLSRGGFDVVLLDLVLPESTGLESLIAVISQYPEIPVVVLTARAEESLAIQALKAGAQDYLIKGEADGKLITKSLRYAIERRRLLAELETVRLREQQEREMRRLESVTRTGYAPMAARLYGRASLQETLPEMFQKFLRTYSRILDTALEAQAFKTDHNTSDDLRQMAEEMGYLVAGPRDIIDIHRATLEHKRGILPDPLFRAAVTEARFLVLELMGHLAQFYRVYYLRPIQEPKASHDPSMPEGNEQ